MFKFAVSGEATCEVEVKPRYTDEDIQDSPVEEKEVISTRIILMSSPLIISMDLQYLRQAYLENIFDFICSFSSRVNAELIHKKRNGYNMSILERIFQIISEYISGVQFEIIINWIQIYLI